MGVSGTHVNKTWKPLSGLVVLAVLLYVAAGVGMAYVAGFQNVYHRLEHATWWWLAPCAGAIAIAFCGYFFAYRGLASAEHGPELDRRALLAVVAAGFGGFLARGGTALDDYAMRAGGAGERESRVRITALGGFEHGVLALILCPASIVAVILAVGHPRADFTWPWAIIPPIGFAVAMWLAERYRDRLRDQGGWHGRVGLFFDAIHIIYEMLRRPQTYGYAVLGMMLYWAGDMFALWAATAAFGVHMTVLNVIVALGTGMVFTRRTAPLGGAGILLVALVATLWYCAGVPFAVATLGVSAYRLLTLFGPMPLGFAALPKLRALGQRGEDAEGHGTKTTKGEPALQH